MMPGSAAGTMTEKAARARVAPRARDPSRRLPGTRFRSSSVVRVMMGIIMNPRASPPASAEKCFTGSTARPYAKMPMTIDGTPFSTSAVKRTSDANGFFPYSDRYTPAITPTGMARAEAIAIRYSVPSIALAMPPPDSPTGFGIFVKKSQLSEEKPFWRT